jgi:hypothetical protein
MTILMPASSPTTRPEWHPDTWNSGEVSSDTVGPPPSAEPPAGLAMVADTVE